MNIWLSIAPSISWIIVIVGWLFVRHDNNTREDRKELRSLLDKIAVEIHELTQKANEYYLSNQDGQTPFKTADIKRRLWLLENRINLLKKYKTKFDNNQTYADFRSAISGNDFEKSDREALLPSNEIYQNMSLKAKDLIEYLENEFMLFYRIGANR